LLAVFCWPVACEMRSPTLAADVPEMLRKSVMFDA
jgi:hypothetical protein